MTQETTHTQDFFRVIPEENRCPNCHKGGNFAIVYEEIGQEIQTSATYDDEEYAEDICEGLNRAYRLGVAERDRPKESTGELLSGLRQCQKAMNAISENFPHNSGFIKALDRAFRIIEKEDAAIKNAEANHG